MIPAGVVVSPIVVFRVKVLTAFWPSMETNTVILVMLGA